MILVLCLKKIVYINIFNKLIFLIVIYFLKNECLIDFIKYWKIGYICNWVDVDDGVIIVVFIFVYVFSYDIIGLNDSCLKEKVKCKNI